MYESMNKLIDKDIKLKMKNVTDEKCNKRISNL